MTLNETMVQCLYLIRRIETRKVSKSLNVSTKELGNRLIEVYYISSNLRTRELITQFMTDAGAVWLRKLLTRDTGPIESSLAPFATMAEYTNLLAANDRDYQHDLTA